MAEITKLNGGGSNCYLVTENNSSILIDTGMKRKRESILKACSNKNVKLIVLTHGHIDHVENAAYLSKMLKVPVAIHEKDIPLLKDNLCRKMSAEGLLGNMVCFFSKVGAKYTALEPFDIDVLLKEGDNLLENYGVNVDIIEFPGHTEGSIGVHVGAEDLIVGDALMNMVRPSVSLLYEDRDRMLASVNKIEKYKDNLIHFGH